MQVGTFKRPMMVTNPTTSLWPSRPSIHLDSTESGWLNGRGQHENPENTKPSTNGSGFHQSRRGFDVVTGGKMAERKRPSDSLTVVDW